jgi:Glycosyltransferases involved in cell wall biogenesis
MSNPLVSVIIPAFNIQNYLTQCIDSIRSQDFDSFEIIIIDDGSTDDTGKIARDYADRDPRIRVVTQSNRGLPSARNAGLSIAQGDYIAHIDGDDWIDAGFLSSMHGCAVKTQADIVFCDFLHDDANGHTWHFRNTSWPPCKSHTPEQFVLEMALQRASHSSWNKFFKRELFSKNKILYPPEILLAEDLATTYRLAMVSSIITKCSGVYYHYRIRPSGSLMQTINYKGRDAYATFQVMQNFSRNLSAPSSFVELTDLSLYYYQFTVNARNLGRYNQATEKHLVFQDFLKNRNSLLQNRFFMKIPLGHRILILGYCISSILGGLVNNIWIYALLFLKGIKKIFISE